MSAFRDATGAWLPLHCIQDCTLVVNKVAEQCGMGHAALTTLALEDSPGPGMGYRAALEEVSLALHAGAAHLENWGLHCQELRVVGGGARNPLWCRILADLFQAPVVVPEEADTAALALQYRVGNIGEFTLQTCLLPDRDQPYLLCLELARHRVMTLYAKLEDWV